MPSFDNVLQRVLRDEGWDVSPGPAEGSLIAESGGERVLLQWSRADGAGGETETITAQADARPADGTDRATGDETPAAGEPDAAEPSPGPATGESDAELLGAGAEADADAGGGAGGPGDVRGDGIGDGGADDGGTEIIDATVGPEDLEGDDPAGPGAEPGGDPTARPAAETRDDPTAGSTAETRDDPSPGTVDGPEPQAPSMEAGGSNAGPEAPPEAAPEAGGQARDPEATEVRDEVPEEVPVVRLRVDQDEARDEARPRLVDIHETILELVPHRAFEYTCRVPDGTGDVETYRGNILLNALTESAVTLEAPRFAEGVPQGARLLEPEVDVDGAIAEARAHLRDRFTRDVQVEEKTGNVSMMETKRVSPDDDGVDLASQGTWYVPVWRLEGRNGTLRIDANRGGVLDESLQKETGTDAEWVA